MIAEIVLPICLLTRSTNSTRLTIGLIYWSSTRRITCAILARRRTNSASCSQKIAHHVVMLSATPINLRNRDLHSLLRLLDEDTFALQDTLEAIIDANAPIIEARDAVLKGKHAAEIRAHLEDASRHDLLSGTRTLTAIQSEIAEHADLDRAHRADLALRLDGLNQLANVINRTRRRDVQEFRVIRDVHGLVFEMVTSEQAVYEQITKVVSRICGAIRTTSGIFDGHASAHACLVHSGSTGTLASAGKCLCRLRGCFA